MTAFKIVAPIFAITEDGYGKLSIAERKLASDTVMVSTVKDATYTRRFISGAEKGLFGVSGYITPLEAAKFQAVGEQGNMTYGEATIDGVTYSKVNGMAEAIAYAGMGSYGDAYTYFEEIKDSDGYWASIKYLIPKGQKFYVEEHDNGQLTANVPYVEYYSHVDIYETVPVPTGKLAIPSGSLRSNFIYYAG